METEKLYYKNTYSKEFTATIVSIKKCEKNIELVLDKTLFYPEGGGQPADKGTINNNKVIDVKIKDDIITHYLSQDTNIDDLQVGTEINGIIDWDIRYENMQLHTAEHIVTGVARKLYGCDNVGFNISENLMTIDLNVDISEEEIRKLELLVNETLKTNATVKITYPTEEELKTLDYRSKLELVNNVRIVTVDNVDICACCGLHCNNVSEIGLVKFISWKRHRGGVRLMCLAGNRALKDYIYKHDSFMFFQELLSSKESEVVEKVEKLNDDLNSAKSKIIELKTELYTIELKNLNGNIFSKNGLESFDLKLIGNIMLDQIEIGYILSESENGVKYAIVSKFTDVRPLAKILNEKFNGKGGGKSDFVQGSLFESVDSIIDFIKSIN